jgi:hypothetical protein
MDITDLGWQFLIKKDPQTETKLCREEKLSQRFSGKNVSPFSLEERSP